MRSALFKLNKFPGTGEGTLIILTPQRLFFYCYLHVLGLMSSGPQINEKPPVRSATEGGKINFMTKQS